MLKLKSKNSTKQMLLLSLPAGILGCGGMLIHNLEGANKPALTLEKVELPRQINLSVNGVDSLDIEVRVTVQYHPRNWYNRLFKRMPKFSCGPINVIDSRGKIQPVSKAMNSPCFGARKENLLPSSSDGSLRYLFIYHLYLPTAPKRTGKLRLVDSIVADGIKVPIDVEIRQ